MKAVTRSTFVGLFVYAGLSFAGWLSMTGELSAAYAVIFIVCTIGVLIGNIGSTNKEVDE